MNSQLEQFARQTIKDCLAQLSENNRLLFKRMYSHKNLDASIDDVVDRIPTDKLDWAMQQVERTRSKKEDKNEPARTEFFRNTFI